MHLPIPTDVTASGIFDQPDTRGTETDPNLLKLPAPGLHGTFAKAYQLLTQINLKIGWDNLLKARSNVFVMEEVQHPGREEVTFRNTGRWMERARVSRA
jgi:hypothetical protein